MARAIGLALACLAYAGQARRSIAAMDKRQYYDHQSSSSGDSEERGVKIPMQTLAQLLLANDPKEAFRVSPSLHHAPTPIRASIRSRSAHGPEMYKKAKKSMKVLLMEPLRNFGEKGDVVDVRPGYGEYLMRSGMALWPNKRVMDNLNREKKEIIAKQTEQVAEARKTIAEIEEKFGSESEGIQFKMVAGPDNVLFGKVTRDMIHDVLEEAGFAVPSRSITAPPDMKKVGEAVANLRFQIEGFTVANVDLRIIVEKIKTKEEIEAEESAAEIKRVLKEEKLKQKALKEEAEAERLKILEEEAKMREMEKSMAAEEAEEAAAEATGAEAPAEAEETEGDPAAPA